MACIWLLSAQISFANAGQSPSTSARRTRSIRVGTQCAVRYDNNSLVATHWRMANVLEMDFSVLDVITITQRSCWQRRADVDGSDCKKTNDWLGIIGLRQNRLHSNRRKSSLDSPKRYDLPPPRHRQHASGQSQEVRIDTHSPTPNAPFAQLSPCPSRATCPWPVRAQHGRQPTTRDRHWMGSWSSMLPAHVFMQTTQKCTNMKSAKWRIVDIRWHLSLSFA